MLETGQLAPDFTLPDQDGEAVSLARLRGRKVASTSTQGGHVGRSRGVIVGRPAAPGGLSHRAPGERTINAPR
jgi:hypothetical protein